MCADTLEKESLQRDCDPFSPIPLVTWKHNDWAKPKKAGIRRTNTKRKKVDDVYIQMFFVWRKQFRSPEAGGDKEDITSGLWAIWWGMLSDKCGQTQVILNLWMFFTSVNPPHTHHTHPPLLPVPLRDSHERPSQWWVVFEGFHKGGSASCWQQICFCMS